MFSLHAGSWKSAGLQKEKDQAAWTDAASQTTEDRSRPRHRDLSSSTQVLSGGLKAVSALFAVVDILS